MSDPERTVDDLIEAVPWSRLAHAYDVALDAPRNLRALTRAGTEGASEDPEELEDWLLSTVVHQGTPYSATAPVLWIARRILGDAREHPALAWCLLAVAESAVHLRGLAERVAGRPPSLALIEPEVQPQPQPRPQRSASGEPLWATYLPQGRELAPRHGEQVHDDYFLAAPADVATLTACVRDWEQTVVECVRDRRFLDEALEAASALVRLAPSTALTDVLVSLIDGADHGPVGGSVRDGHRATAAFALTAAGPGLPDVDALLAHREHTIRVAAALGDPDRPRALGILLDAVTVRERSRAGFPPGLVGPDPWPAAALLTAVLDRVPVDEADDRLVGGLEHQLATVAYGPLGASHEWGRVLAWAFPDRWQPSSFRDVPAPDSLSPLQRRLLGALARNDDPWERGAGNASLALGQVGLPHDRAVVAAVAGLAGPRRRPWWRREVF